MGGPKESRAGPEEWDAQRIPARGRGDPEHGDPMRGGGPHRERGGPAPQTEGPAKGRPPASVCACMYTLIHTSMYRYAHIYDVRVGARTAIS